MANNVNVKLKLSAANTENAISIVSAATSDNAFSMYCIANSIDWNGYDVKVDNVQIDNKSTVKLSYNVNACNFSVNMFVALENLGFDVLANYFDECDSYAGIYAVGDLQKRDFGFSAGRRAPFGLARAFL